MDTGSNSPGSVSRPVVSDNWSDCSGGNSSGLHFLRPLALFWPPLVPMWSV